MVTFDLRKQVIVTDDQSHPCPWLAAWACQLANSKFKLIIRKQCMEKWVLSAFTSFREKGHKKLIIQHNCVKQCWREFVFTQEIAFIFCFLIQKSADISQICNQMALRWLLQYYSSEIPTQKKERALTFLLMRNYTFSFCSERVESHMCNDVADDSGMLRQSWHIVSSLGM